MPPKASPDAFDLSPYTQEQKSVLAMIDGKRDFFKGLPLNTNVCMSQPAVREAMAQEVANYAETHKNIDYLHVWLSDGSKNHCECEECQKMRPSDWYMMIMNRIDEILTEKALGHNEKATELSKQFCDTFGRHKIEMERYYDHSLTCRALEHITRNSLKIILN